MYHIDIHLITRYMCKLDMTMYSVNYWVFIPSVFVHIALVLCMLSCSSESIYKSKATEKVSGLLHMVCLIFYWEKSEKFGAENRCRYCVNNAIKLWYYLSGSFSLLSGFNCLLDDCFLHSSWINGLSSHVRPFIPESTVYEGRGPGG